MWHGHPFNQRNKKSKIAGQGRVKVGSNRKRGWTKFYKGGVGNRGRVFITWVKVRNP